MQNQIFAYQITKVRSKLIINTINLLILITAMIISSNIRLYLPFTPVPITAQTLVILLGSAWLGSNLAPLSIIFYITIGLIGFPVFANGGGLDKLIGPTGGYYVLS